MKISFQKSKMIPSEVFRLIEKLNSAGYEAYIVGGCLRDIIMGRVPHDFDICTDALPEESIRVFSEDYTVLEVGRRYGTVVVICGGVQYEITTYRIDGDYLDNRRPETVEFTLDLIKDLSRRDFTVNAMAYDPLSGEFVDPFCGLADIKRKKIKCVGEPQERFFEDGLRIMRALRFSSQLGFRIEPETARAIRNNKEILANISHERIQSELTKILLSSDCGADVLREYSEVFAVILPELAPMFGFNQCNAHHIYDVWEHTLHALSEPVEDFVPDLITRLALLFHDTGKPHTFSIAPDGTGHFYCHANVSAEICDYALRRLKFPSDVIEKTVWLVKKHDMPLLEDRTFIKRQLNKVDHEQLTRLIELHAHDTAGQAPELWLERMQNVKNVTSILESIIKEGECFSLKDLAVTGKDILGLGIPQGREVGKLLDWILSKVISGELDNSKDAIIDFVNEIIKSGKVG